MLSFFVQGYRMMKNTSFTIFSIVVTLFTNIFADENEKQYQIIFSDNVTLTGGPNDLGPTGNLKFIYTNPFDESKISFDWEIYVNGPPEEKVVGRTNPGNYRIDALRMFYMKGETFMYGAGIEILGNLGGKSVQNNIHELVGDSYIPATYTDGTHVTPTLNLEYTHIFWEGNIDLFASLRLPFIIKNGILDFQLHASHTFTNIYQTGIATTIGINMDCKKYPDLISFSGYPLRDFNICTPESILAVSYNDFTFFWEIPLSNNDVQNSIMGFSYHF